MKKTLLTAFLAVALVGAAQAQSQQSGPGAFQNLSSTTGSVEVLTTIINPIAAQEVAPIDFGFIQYDGTNTNIGAPVQQGEIQITAFGGTTISITDSGPVTLTGSGGTVTFNPDGANTGTFDMDTGTGPGTVKNKSLTGSLDISGAAEGGYSGDYTLTFNYSSI